MNEHAPRHRVIQKAGTAKREGRSLGESDAIDYNDAGIAPDTPDPYAAWGGWDISPEMRKRGYPATRWRKP